MATRWPTPNSKVHGANMGPIWGRQDPGGPHVGPMNFVLWDPSSISVNTMQAMTSLGSVFMFPCGILVNRFGCRIVSIIGELFGILAYGLVALATHTRNFHEEHPFLLHCYFLASSKAFSSHLPRSSWSYMVYLLLAHYFKPISFQLIVPIFLRKKVSGQDTK